MLSLYFDLENFERQHKSGKFECLLLRLMSQLQLGRVCTSIFIIGHPWYARAHYIARSYHAGQSLDHSCRSL